MIRKNKVIDKLKKRHKRLIRRRNLFLDHLPWIPLGRFLQWLSDEELDDIEEIIEAQKNIEYLEGSMAVYEKLLRIGKIK